MIVESNDIETEDDDSDEEVIGNADTSKSRGDRKNNRARKAVIKQQEKILEECKRNKKSVHKSEEEDNYTFTCSKDMINDDIMNKTGEKKTCDCILIIKYTNIIFCNL